MLFNGTINVGANYQLNCDGAYGLLYIRMSTSGISRHEVYVVLNENIYACGESSLLVTGLANTIAGVTTSFSEINSKRTLTITNTLTVDIPVEIILASFI